MNLKHSVWAGVGHCQNFRGFDIRGVPYVYINREIQGMPVYGAKKLYKCAKSQKKKIVHCPFLQSQAKYNGVHLKKTK